MSRGGQFRTVKTPKVRRNKMNMSHERRLTADPFWLYPVLLEMCIPGDTWKLSNEMIVRMNPLVAPMMHEINAYVHYYFVPFRLLWDQWEDYITGGRDGKFTADLPLWHPDTSGQAPDWTVGSLWDYMFGHALPTLDQDEPAKYPLAFPLRAYNLIWNEYYRDQNIVEELDINLQDTVNKGLLRRAWQKDYFTSALPWQQRGIAPAISLSDDLHLEYPLTPNDYMVGPATQYVFERRDGTSTTGYFGVGDSTISATGTADRLKAYLDSAKLASGSQPSFDVSELRLVFQLQKFLERNARSGARYVEFLKAHFPAWPRDDRLNRPEYIGGSKTPIIVSEVLQTSSSDGTSPQGNMAGHGISADRTYCGTYRVQEHGLILGLLSFLPKAMYQQGIDRQWLVESKYDFYFPEFSALSEQAIFTPEIYNVSPAPVDNVFGYQGRYDEYRFRRSMVHSLFRTDFQHWHMGRVFATAPSLNYNFIYPSIAEIESLKRVMAVPTEPMFLVALGNRNTAIRPMPWIAEPGLIDHF